MDFGFNVKHNESGKSLQGSINIIVRNGRRLYQINCTAVHGAVLTRDQARTIATELGIDFDALGCDLEQFRLGLGVELEHRPRDPETDLSGDDPIVTGKIAFAHLTEFPDYYTRLAGLERKAAAVPQKRK